MDHLVKVIIITNITHRKCISLLQRMSGLHMLAWDWVDPNFVKLTVSIP